SARYFYYLGRIKAIQLDYTASHSDLVQAIRKAPKNPKSAGFQQAVHKLAIIVQLLTGEIPERSLFREPFLLKALVPYLSITQAVRIGDLAKFQDTLAKHTATFRADKTYTLILRLRHNVIKTGIRMISLAYSKISLRDICLKLQLDSEEDAEYIVAKAIRDGVIDAVLDHENGFMKSKENVDIYSTNEPQNAFHQRISFCLNLHNESVKALRFPYAQRKEQSTMDALREEERLIAGELAEGDLADDDDMGDF
ncbi:26S proteasome non-ATPase regulatory subunit, partial [Rhizoclosmatium hyalinum]